MSTASARRRDDGSSARETSAFSVSRGNTAKEGDTASILLSLPQFGPAVGLPLAVWLLEPVDLPHGNFFVATALAAGVFVSVMLPRLRWSLPASCLIGLLLISAAHMQELQAQESEAFGAFHPGPHRIHNQADSVLPSPVTSNNSNWRAVFVNVPKGRRHISGTYLVVEGRQHRGLPIWKHAVRPTWIYPMVNNLWGIGGQAELEVDFETDSAMVFCNVEHHGRKPGEYPCVWKYNGDAGWQDDAHILVRQATAEEEAQADKDAEESKARPAEPRGLTIVTGEGPHYLAGQYLLDERKRPQDLPIWKHVNEEAFLYPMNNGMWGIGGAHEAGSDFNSDQAFLFCPIPHRGLMPDMTNCVWKFFTGFSWDSDEGTIVTATPSAEIAFAKAVLAEVEVARAAVRLETMSVVLPCAYEGVFASKTVEAILKNTPHEALSEIIVVDDGSQPPLSTEFPQHLLEKAEGKVHVWILRHERTMGLISAKKSGGDAAKGDVIVFFDCHISPRRGWEASFFRQMKRAGDHRTVVVPTITSLDPDTFEELTVGNTNGQGCYVTLNADFTWISVEGHDVPLMSGGLLAIGRQWWQETGGYDSQMVAWGGENIDQSMRIWLCGGRIELASGAYVAHMWRDPKNPKTRLKYPIPTKDVMRNKARAVKGWFDDFANKTFTFPEYGMFGPGKDSIGDMTEFVNLKKKLSCAPFSDYINRFSKIYVDGGLIPTEVFQLFETKSGMCLERQPDEGSSHVVLAHCGRGDAVPELQLWHGSNRDTHNRGKCCSGIANWNFLLCLDAPEFGKIVTSECGITGGAHGQQFQLSDTDGSLLWRNGEGCVAPSTLEVQSHFAWAGGCTTIVEEFDFDGTGSSETHLRGTNVKVPPAAFRLRSSAWPNHPGGLCATAAPLGSQHHDPGSALSFLPCDDSDKGQIFHAKPLLGGYQISSDTGERCIDAGGGSHMQMYPCYDIALENANQAWKVADGHLVRADDIGQCIDVMPAPAEKAVKRADGSPFTLEVCSTRKGQLLAEEDRDALGTFLIRDVLGSKKCLGAGPADPDKFEQAIILGECEASNRWQILEEREQVKHIGTGKCLDAAGGKHPVLYSCHEPRASSSQRWEYIRDPGLVRTKQDWGDNGRKRYFEHCLDYAPEAPTSVSVMPCAQARASWTKINPYAPLERRIWDNVPKPSPDALPLGIGLVERRLAEAKTKLKGRAAT